MLLALAARRVSRVTAAASRRPTVDTLKRPDLVSREERPKGEQYISGVKFMQRGFSKRNRQFWDYTVWPRQYFQRAWKGKDIGYLIFFLCHSSRSSVCAILLHLEGACMFRCRLPHHWHVRHHAFLPSTIGAPIFYNTQVVRVLLRLLWRPGFAKSSDQLGFLASPSPRWM